MLVLFFPLLSVGLGALSWTLYLKLVECRKSFQDIELEISRIADSIPNT